MVSNNMTEMSSEVAGQWLGGSQLLNLHDHKSRNRAMRIKQLASRASQKAVFIQDFVKSLLFGCVAAFDQLPARCTSRWPGRLRYERLQPVKFFALGLDLMRFVKAVNS